MPSLFDWLLRPKTTIAKRRRRLDQYIFDPPRSATFDASRETVIVISHQASRTGAPIVGYNICLHLSQKYNVVSVLLAGGPILSDFYSVSVQTIFRHHIRKLRRFFKSSGIHPKYAVVNSVEAIATVPLLRSHNVPVVLLVHEFASYVGYKEKLVESLRSASAIVFSSALTRESALEEFSECDMQNSYIFPQGKCVLPASATGLDDTHTKNKIEAIRALRNSGASIVLGAGSVNLRKGVDLFIQTAGALSRIDSGGHVHFVWVGGGFDPKLDVAYSIYLKEQIVRSGLSDKISVIDEVTDIAAIYGLADIFFLSSRLDPLPNVSIEAASAGLPVVCFRRASGFANLVAATDRLRQLTVDYLDVDAAARLIAQILNDSDLRSELSKTIALFAAQTFNMERYIEKLDHLCDGPDLQSHQ
jgi:glycosyltransferase involved in cell wall biosynthesis